MPPAPPPRRLFRVLAVLWVATLWVPVLQMLFHPVPEPRSPIENRAKAPPPAFTGGWAGTARAFPAAFDRYFGDAFGFRDQLIAAQAGILHGALGMSPTDKVVLGTDGWLFYNGASDGVSLSDYCGLEPFSSRDLEAIERNLTSLASHLSERGAVFAVLVAPSKHTIYPEHLPEGIRKLAGKSRLDQLAERLAGRPGIAFVDPREALLAEKARHRVYFRTDTHWNGEGAFVAYRELMQALGRAGAPVPAPLAQRRREPLAASVRDLSRMLGVPEPPLEEDVRLERPAAPRTRATALPLVRGDLFAPELCESDAPGLPRLLVFRDSFAEQLKPLLCPDFSRSVFLWRHRVDRAALDAERPAIVVLEITERYLGRLGRKRLVRLGAAEAEAEAGAAEAEAAAADPEGD